MIREETIKHIQQHAVPPPPEVWGKIATALDNMDTQGSPTTTPIVTLEHQPQAVTNKRFHFKAQIAAAILLIIGTAIIWNQRNQRKETTAMIVAATSDSSTVGGTTIYPPTPTAPIAGDLSDAAIAGGQQVRAITTPKFDTRKNLRPAKVQFAAITSTNYLREPNTRTLEKILADDTLEGESPLINDNYFYITSKEGQQVRVSKKIASAVLDDWGIDPTHSSNSKLELLELTNKIAAWKSKLASSAFIPSASNLMDLLYFIDLQED